MDAEEIFLFEGFRLDRRAGGLFKPDENGVRVPVSIGSRALDLLTLLVMRHGDLVSKEEIMSAVWPGMTVADSNLPTQVWALRRVLDHRRSRRSYIQTVAGRGYRFTAAVSRAVAETRSAANRISSATALSQPIVAPWLSIVVLPFANFGDRPDRQYFAKRITDDLTIDLSRFTGMRVVSRSTAMTYRNGHVGAKQIGRELGIRYVLEGSVRYSASHVRVNAQLIDAQTDTHIWAERFDYDPGDLFGVQDEITKRTAVALYIELISTEAAQAADHPDAYQYILKGRVVRLNPLNRDNHSESIGLFERALALDPNSVEAKAWLAESLAQRALDEMADSVAADIARAAALATQAVAALPRSASAHVAKGRVLAAQGRYDEAILEYAAANAINPSWPHIYGALSECEFWSGSIEDAIPLAEKATGMRPRDAFSAVWYFGIGRVHLVRSRANEALVWLEKACNANLELPSMHAWLASASALSGDMERARSELAQAQGLSRDGRYSSIVRLKEAGYFGVPKIRQLFEDTYLAGLRRAGMPEE